MVQRESMTSKSTESEHPLFLRPAAGSMCAGTGQAGELVLCRDSLNLRGSSRGIAAWEVTLLDLGVAET